jgi:small-conductance mechanosensitive channel
MSYLTESKMQSTSREPTHLALEKEIGVAISQYEEEKRIAVDLDVRIKALEVELNGIRAKKAEGETSGLLGIAAALAKKLEVCQAQFNTMQNENTELRNKIDHLRIVKSSFKAKIKALEEDLERAKTMTKTKAEQQSKEKEQENKKLTEIRLAMSKSANEKLRYTQKLEAITEVLRKDKNTSTMKIQKLHENLDGLLNKELKVIDNGKVIKELAKRFQHEIKRTNFKLTKIKHHNQKLSELFNVLKEIGFVDNENDFVTDYLSYYEESTKLSKYLLELNAEIDSLEFANRKIQSNLEENSTFIFTSRTKSSKIHSALTHSIASKYSCINESLKHQSVLKAHLESIKPSLLSLMQLRKSLNLSYSQSDLTEDSTTDEHLLAVEEMVQGLRLFDLHAKNEDLVKSLVLTPSRSRNLTPEFNVMQI